MEMNLQKGVEGREAGKAQAESGNEAFLAVARAYARAYAKLHGCVTIDEVRQRMNELGMKPRSKACWGTVFKSSEFQIMGYRRTRLTSSHARMISVWSLKN